MIPADSTPAIPDGQSEHDISLREMLLLLDEIAITQRDLAESPTFSGTTAALTPVFLRRAQVLDAIAARLSSSHLTVDQQKAIGHGISSIEQFCLSDSGRSAMCPSCKLSIAELRAMLGEENG